MTELNLHTQAVYIYDAGAYAVMIPAKEPGDTTTFRRHLGEKQFILLDGESTTTPYHSLARREAGDKSIFLENSVDQLATAQAYGIDGAHFPVYASLSIIPAVLLDPFHMNRFILNAWTPMKPTLL